LLSVSCARRSRRAFAHCSPIRPEAACSPAATEPCDERRPLALIVAAGCAAALAPLAHAQQAVRPKRIGVLLLGDAQGSTASLLYVAGLKVALRERGWIEGENVVFEVRSAQGRTGRLPEVARELVALAPDVIWTALTPGALAARQVTTTIPIVGDNLRKGAALNSVQIAEEMMRRGLR
jgi:ABC-type uncharacterized transport system substrate-binding protein